MLKEQEIVKLPKVSPGDRMTDDEFFEFAPEDPVACFVFSCQRASASAGSPRKLLVW